MKDVVKSILEIADQVGEVLNEDIIRFIEEYAEEIIDRIEIVVKKRALW